MPKRPRIAVLHEDEAVLVLDKPAGIRTVPDRYDREATHVKELLGQRYGDLWIVHRLDRETSGVLVVARSAEAHQALNGQFAAHTVQKTYHLLTPGQPIWEAQTVDLPLHVDADRLHRTVADYRKGKPALTDFRVLERLGGYACVEARPQTGRTHQIRVHLAAVHAPIACDALYGPGTPILLSHLKRRYKPNRTGEERPLMARMALHAHALHFLHPLSQQPLTVEAPYPKDFAATLNQLRKHQG